MGVLEHLFGRQRADLDVIASPPPDVAWRSVRPRESHCVHAKLATRDGKLTGKRGSMRYIGGRHYIVERKDGDRSVVSRAVFERTYRRRPDGAYEKRPEITYRYFVLPYEAVIETPEGRQRAAAGDWIMQGVEGELWPVDPEKAASIYTPA